MKDSSLELRLEQERNKIIKVRKRYTTTLLTVLCSILGMFIYALILGTTQKGSIIPLGVIFFANFTAFFFYLPRYGRKLEREVEDFPKVYKHYMVENIMKGQFRDFSYNEKNSLPMEVIREILSSQYIEWNDRNNKLGRSGEDYISGSYNDIEFPFQNQRGRRW